VYDGKGNFRQIEQHYSQQRQRFNDRKEPETNLDSTIFFPEKQIDCLPFSLP
jgi:hypothetical protein